MAGTTKISGSGLADDVGFIDALVTALMTNYSGLPSQHFSRMGSPTAEAWPRLACESQTIRGIGVVATITCPSPKRA